MPGYGVMIFKIPNRRLRITRMILWATGFVVRSTRGRWAQSIADAGRWMIVSYCLDGPWNKRRW